MHDMQMARGEVEGGFNLAVGEPVLLQEHLKFPDFVHSGPVQYPPIVGHKKLIAELRLRYNHKHIVVANGAKQALLAAFYAFKNVHDATNVLHASPYWPSYPTLAKLSALKFGNPSEDLLRPARIYCETVPNNPDGRIPVSPWHDIDVWDACYAHWVYGWNQVSVKARITVAGSAKLLGTAGARVGWLLTDDDGLAEEAAKYIEFTTSGVSLLSQAYVAECLNYQRTVDDMQSSYGCVRKQMIYNGELCKAMLGKVGSIHGFPEHGGGMFAWIEIPANDRARFAQALIKAKVTVVNGKACGNDTDGFYRLNMCHLSDYTFEALTAIKENL